MPYQGCQILRNIGKVSDSETGLWVRQLLIVYRGRKFWVVAEGVGNTAATEAVWKQLALKQKAIDELHRTEVFETTAND